MQSAIRNSDSPNRKALTMSVSLEKKFSPAQIAKASWNRIERDYPLVGELNDPSGLKRPSLADELLNNNLKSLSDTFSAMAKGQVIVW